MRRPSVKEVYRTNSSDDVVRVVKQLRSAASESQAWGQSAADEDVVEFRRLQPILVAATMVMVADDIDYKQPKRLEDGTLSKTPLLGLDTPQDIVGKLEPVDMYRLTEAYTYMKDIGLYNQLDDTLKSALDASAFKLSGHADKVRAARKEAEKTSVTRK